MLIPGPESALDRNIDVYLAPLVEELKKLWNEGVLTYDILQGLGRANPFLLRAIVLLTIADSVSYTHLTLPTNREV